MNNKRQWTFLKHVIFSIVITLIVYISSIILEFGSIIFKLGGLDLFGKHQAASIAIIGGADGPTAIYTTMGFPMWLILNRYMVLFLILLVFYKPFNRLLVKVFGERMDID